MSSTLERQDPCRGCGQRPEDLQPTDAIASLRLLQRRSAIVLRRCRPDRQPPTGPRRDAVESAAAIPAVLAAADRRLRRLLRESDLPSEPASPKLRILAATAADTEEWAGLALVSETVERLVATIVGATAEDWYRRHRIEGVSAAEVVWLAMHDAVHHFEAVELAFAPLSSRGNVVEGLPATAEHRGT